MGRDRERRCQYCDVKLGIDETGICRPCELFKARVMLNIPLFRALLFRAEYEKTGEHRQPICVSGPYDLEICFEAQEALARAGAGEEGISVERAVHFADPGCVNCPSCPAFIMRDGEIMLCTCGTFIHVPTGNKMTHDEVWLVNHRPPQRIRKP